MIFIGIIPYHSAMDVWQADYNVSIQDANESPSPVIPE